ncbi:MAG: hypothetical protein HY347_10855 [candidate division NC10 bacterium]|nr:hypothetical protein [candidate division NC10 bacterium]
MRRRSALFGLALLFLVGSSVSEAGTLPKLILSLGRDGYLPQAAVEDGTGAEVRREMGEFQLTDFSLVILSNLSFGSLPLEIRDGLGEFVNKGGTLLITGGTQSFGSGGYQAIASLLPFTIRAANDWAFKSFRAPVPLQAGHRSIAGITFPPIGGFNDMNPKPGAVEILQYAGGGRAGFPAPLIAERRVGSGLVLGVAFDPNELASWSDRHRFAVTVVQHLMENSKLGPPKPPR